ncbi:MAG: hypothetical protein A3I66_00630 [Burkholderiales bacterium RIFCSPLOWO2_02_FULL_57_36]|nr:MAG: hypothetical protein A3I66_00630 [Burkholderiales bacterium RIFCSPLOWO2_02_FULL_57_36]
MFNIKKLAILATAVMTVRNAAGEPQLDEAGAPLTIALYGPGSKPYQAAKHKAEERNSTRAFARMQGKAEGKQSEAEKRAERAEFLAACTVAFNGFGLDGLAGYELYKAVYADIEIGHIAEDAEKFLGERANFLPLPANSSPSTSATQPG